MNFTYIKYLQYIIKEQKIDWIDFAKHFHIERYEAVEIINFLRDNGYVVYIGDGICTPTIKGKGFIKDLLLKYIFSNFLAILAIIISVIALFK